MKLKTQLKELKTKTLFKSILILGPVSEEKLSDLFWKAFLRSYGHIYSITFSVNMFQQSENQEQGFFPQIPIIQISPRRPSQAMQRRPANYKPHQLSNSTPLKQLPSEVYEYFNTVPVIESSEQYRPLPQPRKDNSKQMTVFDKYCKNSSYFVVYDKQKKIKINKEQSNIGRKLYDYLERHFPLGSIFSYNQSDYTQLKETSIKDCFFQSKNQTNLQFDSKFECGNLSSVFLDPKAPHFYHCLLQQDTNTYGYTQWFYFALRGTKKDTLYRFVIPNMRKRFSFYKTGMKPILFSFKKFKKTGNGWFRRGYNINYHKSDLYFMREKQKIFYYSLYFELDFDEEDDWITISFNFPYSYSRLIHQLERIKEIARQKEDLFFKINTLEYTVCNNLVPQVVITNVSPDEEHDDKVIVNDKLGKKSDKPKGSSYSKKKVIVILARQHPCETNSSFLAEQLMSILVTQQNNYRLKWLLDTFQFRLYPMVNVDGVIYGNSRCDVTGTDINRSWKYAIKQLQPQVVAMRRTIRDLHMTNKIAYCLDLHSHSKDKGIFSYSFKERDQVLSRLFAFLMGGNCEYFSFKACQFSFPTKQKASTARAVIGRTTGNLKVITIQSSYYAVKKQGQDLTLEPKLFHQVGMSLLYTLKSYLKGDRAKKDSLKYMKDNIASIIAETKSSVEQDNGSDSEPQIDALQEQKRLQLLVPVGHFRLMLSNKLQRAIEQADKESDMQPIQVRNNDNEEYNGFEHVAYTERMSLLLQRRYQEKQESHIPFEEISERQKSVSPYKKLRKSDFKRYEYNIQTTRKSNLMLWKSKLKKLKTQNSQISNLSLLKAPVEQSQPSEQQQTILYDDSEFRQGMKKLYKNLRSDKRQQNLRLLRIKRDNQFLIRNSRPNVNHLNQMPRKSLERHKIQSLLLSDSKSERTDHQDGEALGGRYMLQRSFQDQFKRLKMPYIQRHNLNMANLCKMLRSKQSKNIKTDPS